MTKEAQDVFHVTELYLLANAFSTEVLFGLPDKKLYQLKGKEVFDEAFSKLKQKNIFTEAGKLTKGGAYVIRALELYNQSKKYVRLHNVMFAFQEKEEDEIIMLTEIEDQTYYRLAFISKALVLTILGERFPLILREPKADEKNFFKKEASPETKKVLSTYDPGESNHFMNLEFFHMEEQPQHMHNANFYQQWLIFTKDDALWMVDPMTDTYYHASQYAFLQLLFDEMDFPYKEGAING